MTVKVNIDYLVKKTPFLKNMLHFADSKGNKNGMLDNTDEVSTFLKLAKIQNNQENLKKLGITITDNGNNSFIITKTKKEAQSKLNYDLNNKKIEQVMTCDNAKITMEFKGCEKSEGEVLYKGTTIQLWEDEDGEREICPVNVFASPSLFTVGKFTDNKSKAWDVAM